MQLTLKDDLPFVSVTVAHGGSQMNVPHVLKGPTFAFTVPVANNVG